MVDASLIPRVFGRDYQPDGAEPHLPFDKRRDINKDRSLDALLERFGMALFGGISLVGPMLLVVFHDLASDAMDAISSDNPICFKAPVAHVDSNTCIEIAVRVDYNIVRHDADGVALRIPLGSSCSSVH